MVVELEPDYYLRHFDRVVEIVRSRDTALLSEDERDTLDAVHRLPRRCRMLFLRLLGRRRPTARSGLHYAEIEALQPSLDHLLAEGHALAGAAVLEVFDAERTLSVCTVAELRERAEAAGLSPSGRKAELVERLAAAGDAAALADDRQLVAARHGALVRRLEVLFFGNRFQSLLTFVLSEVGATRYPRYDVDPGRSLFASRAELEEYMELATVLDGAARDLDGPRLVAVGRRCAAALDAPDSPSPPRSFDLPWLRCAVAFLCGRQLERLGRIEDAIDLHRAVADGPEASWAAQSADRIGLLAGRGDTDSDGFRRLAARLERRPLDAFARYTLRKRCERLGLAHPRTLATPPVVELSLPAVADRGRKRFAGPDGPTTVEEATRQALAGDAIYAENSLPGALFVLLLWDCVFAPIPGAFVHPFQRAPLDLFTDAFHGRREACIARRIESLEGGDVERELRAAHAAHRGESVPFVRWEHQDEDRLARVVRALGAPLLPLLRWIARHPGRHTQGFPDLLHFVGDGAELVEVKGPNDSLRLEQRVVHDLLLRMGFAVRIARVRAV